MTSRYCQQGVGFVLERPYKSFCESRPSPRWPQHSFCILFAFRYSNYKKYVLRLKDYSHRIATCFALAMTASSVLFGHCLIYLLSFYLLGLVSVVSCCCTTLFLLSLISFRTFIISSSLSCLRKISMPISIIVIAAIMTTISIALLFWEWQNLMQISCICCDKPMFLKTMLLIM